MFTIQSPQGPVSLTLSRLTRDRLEETAALCARCAGEGLHTAEALAGIMDDPNHLYFLLLDPQGRTIGYHHTIKSTPEAVAQFSHLTPEHFTSLCSRPDPVVADLRSVGVDDRYRGYGLAVALAEKSVAYAAENWSADIAVAACWKHEGVVPAAPPLTRLGFRFLAEAHHIWYDREGLVCPYCSGRCECPADIYYKLFSQEATP